MEDVYENLHNYEDLNKVVELKHENQELKSKVEECTSAIEALQRAFDNLAKEHKKLAHNYSSLLKTAKAEIERKTKMISELNIEKDKLVINARQNFIQRKQQRWNRERNNTKSNNNPNLCANDKPAVNLDPQNPKHDCKRDQHSSTQNSKCYIKTDENVSNNTEIQIDYKNNTYDRTTEMCKENDMHESNKPYNDSNNYRPKTVFNRRKSLPATSFEAKFSSEEDCENSVEYGVRKKSYQPKEELVKRFNESNYYNNRLSETSSVENNYPQYKPQTSSGYSKYKTNRYNYNERSSYRNRNEYSYRDRYRKKYSPERPHYGRAGNSGDDYNQRYGRDHRSNYGRDRSSDSFRNRNDDERYAEKHKLTDDHEEPRFKRQRVDNNYRHSYNYNSYRNDMDYSDKTIQSPLEPMEQSSCQSPDHVTNKDNVSVEPSIENKNDPCVDLEDPRPVSNQYKVITHNNKEFLTTVVGRNVNIYRVNAKDWNFKPGEMPKALVEPPQDYSDQFVESIYYDIDNPINNKFSIESPQSLKTSAESDGTPKYISDNEMPVENDNIANTFQNPQNVNKKSGKDLNSKSTDSNSKPQRAKCSKDQTISTVSLESEDNTQNRTEKSKANQLEMGKDNDNTSNINVIENVKDSSLENIKQLTDKSIPPDQKSMPQLNMNSELLENENNFNTVIDNYDERIKGNSICAESTHYGYEVSTKIVEDDLILSDETNDAFDADPKFSKKFDKSDGNKSLGFENLNKNSDSPSLKTKEKEKKNDEHISKDKRKSVDHNKKQKGKKKSIESTSSDHSKSSKTKRSKKEKDDAKAQDMKSKFSDLFGDSSSLITPDDLGINNGVKEIRNNYDNMFEDTQAAVDLNFKEIEKIQTEKQVKSVIPQNNQEEKINLKTPPSKDISSVPDSSKNEGDSFVKEHKTECSKNSGSDDKVKNAVNHFVVNESNLTNVIGVVDEESSDVVKTIIISTGVQPQRVIENTGDFTKPKNVIISIEEESNKCQGLHALATSTPAKETQESNNETFCESILKKQHDCSSSTSSINGKVLSAPTDQSMDTNIGYQKDLDEPDVRLFVKRKRKLKKARA